MHFLVCLMRENAILKKCAVGSGILYFCLFREFCGEMFVYISVEKYFDALAKEDVKCFLGKVSW